jgi:hypothetical protein
VRNLALSFGETPALRGASLGDGQAAARSHIVSTSDTSCAALYWSAA